MFDFVIKSSLHHQNHDLRFFLPGCHDCPSHVFICKIQNGFFFSQCLQVQCHHVVFNFTNFLTFVAENKVKTNIFFNDLLVIIVCFICKIQNGFFFTISSTSWVPYIITGFFSFMAAMTVLPVCFDLQNPKRIFLLTICASLTFWTSSPHYNLRFFHLLPWHVKFHL